MLRKNALAGDAKWPRFIEPLARVLEGDSCWEPLEVAEIRLAGTVFLILRTPSPGLISQETLCLRDEILTTALPKHTKRDDPLLGCTRVCRAAQSPCRTRICAHPEDLLDLTRHRRGDCELQKLSGGHA
jgi:hypothetical protein